MERKLGTHKFKTQKGLSHVRKDGSMAEYWMHRIVVPEAVYDALESQEDDIIEFWLDDNHQVVMRNISADSRKLRNRRDSK